MAQRIPVIFIWILISALLISACGGASTAPADTQNGESSALTVVATTTLVGDIVKNVGGDTIDLVVLIPPDVDEHGFEPTPQDITKVAQADLVFINGVGLEGFIEKLMRNAGGSANLITVSEGIQLQEGLEHLEEEGEEHEEEEEPHEGDPHVWTDPNNVLIWVDNIEKALVEANPEQANLYKENASQYRQQLQELDVWISDQVETIPAERRKLVTDHTVFTYFASRYGFEQVGTIVPGYSTQSAPSAQELAALEDSLHELNVPAIFVGNTVNPETAERVAKDTQTELVHILTGSLTSEDGPAPTYLEYMRYNVSAIAEALK